MMNRAKLSPNRVLTVQRCEESEQHAQEVASPPRISRSARGNARMQPSTCNPADILALQQMLGNRAVQRLLAAQRPFRTVIQPEPLNKKSHTHIVQRTMDEESISELRRYLLAYYEELDTQSLDYLFEYFSQKYDNFEASLEELDKEINKRIKSKMSPSVVSEKDNSSSSWQTYTVAANSFLYHSSKESKFAIDRNRQLYFSLNPQDHHKFLFACKIKGNIDVIDLTVLDNVRGLYTQMMVEGANDVGNILIKKTDAKLNERGEIISISTFRSPSRKDDGIVDQWFKMKGLPGWYGPLKIAGEVMLTSVPMDLVGDPVRWKG